MTRLDHGFSSLPNPPSIESPPKPPLPTTQSGPFYILPYHVLITIVCLPPILLYHRELAHPRYHTIQSLSLSKCVPRRKKNGKMLLFRRRRRDRRQWGEFLKKVNECREPMQKTVNIPSATVMPKIFPAETENNA